jgi:hypothetical protein
MRNNNYVVGRKNGNIVNRETKGIKKLYMYALYQKTQDANEI